MKPSKPLCFVIGPIGSSGSEVRRRADFLLKMVIRPALEGDDFNYLVKRADEEDDPGSISRMVIQDVISAELVIADLTGFNPNVFYELGLRHFAKRAAIHVITESVRLPFDNQDQRVIFIDTTDAESILRGRDDLARAARRVKEPGFVVSNPITHANALTEVIKTADPKDKLLISLEERLSRMEQRARLVTGMMPSNTLPLSDARDKVIGTWGHVREGLVGLAKRHDLDRVAEEDFGRLLSELRAREALPDDLMSLAEHLTAEIDRFMTERATFIASDRIERFDSDATEFLRRYRAFI